MLISAANLLWLTDPHDLQDIPTPMGTRIVLDWESTNAYSLYLTPADCFASRFSPRSYGGHYVVSTMQVEQ
jgi:hypothetical protein